MDEQARRLSRRGVLRIGALALLAPPLLSACGPQQNTAPNGVDLLTPLYAAALADVAAANLAARTFPSDAPTFQVMAQVRQAHATALAHEISRAAATTAAPSTPPTSPVNLGSDETSALSTLVDSLNHAAGMASMVQTVPRYRAGLVASICGGCASLAMALNGSPVPSAAQTDALLMTGMTAPSTLDADTTAALQKALAAEHAAFWVCGTANTFLSGTAGSAVNAATVAHQVRRDTTEQILGGTGATPQQSQAAYRTPQPIADTASALTALAAAEQDVEVAWRAVTENTDDKTIRWVGYAGLAGSALWQTAWRHLAGLTPASVAMPGQPS